MSRVRKLAAPLPVAFLLLAVAPAVVLGAEPAFGQPTAATTLGQPITMTSTVTGDDVGSVDVVMRLAGNETAVIVAAEPTGQPNEWRAEAEIDVASSALCACHASGNSVPNTRFSYQFRVRAADGSTTLGPVAQAVVSDDRFTWQTFEQDLVRVHWYEGDQAFAQDAVRVANEAIDRASELLGTTLPDVVDLFVYATEDDMRSAISPNRENIAGQAHSDIDTMFVHIPPGSSVDDFAGTLIAHELTHLVMNEATDNPYHGVPRWMDEGVAVYLSEGYNSFWQAPVNNAVATRTLIPLDGLRALFPSSQDEFYLAYAESVAAIDFFIRTHGEEKLWELVGTYAEGVSDDDAFSAATGADVGAFNEAWFASLGIPVPAPVGPQPGAPGPVPGDWTTDPAQPGPVVTPPPVVIPPSSPGIEMATAVVGAIIGIVSLIGLILILVAIKRARPYRPPLV